MVFVVAEKERKIVMPEYIDKDKLLNDIECIDITDCTDIDDIIVEVERTIDEQPTADVAEVKHGKWIEHPHFNFEGGYSGADYECSMCGYSDCVYEEYNYCPNCGAKMDKE